MGLQIQVGGGAAQLGAGIGAGAVNEIERQKKQAREDQLIEERRLYEQQVRLGVEAFQAGQATIGREFTSGENRLSREFTSGENQLSREFTSGENQLGREARIENREDEQQARVGMLTLEEQVRIGQEERASAREDEARARETEAAQNVGRLRVGLMFDDRAPADGEAPSARHLEDQAMRGEIEEAIARSSGLSEVSALLHDADRALSELNEQRDIADVTAMAVALSAPDESGKSFFNPAEAARLEAAGQTGDVGALKLTYAEVFEAAQARSRRLALIDGVSAYGLQIASEYIGSPPADPDLAPWHASQSKLLESEIELYAKIANALGEYFEPELALRALQDIIAEKDPKTLQAIADQERLQALEDEKARLRLQAEYALRQDPTISSAQRNALLEEGGIQAGGNGMTASEAFMEAQRLYAAGDYDAAGELLDAIDAAAEGHKQ